MDLFTALAGFIEPVMVTIEPYAGSGGTKPLYAAGVPVGSIVEQKRRLVRDPQGREVTSETTVYVPLATACPDAYRITLPDGQVTTVITVSIHRAHGNTELPEHLEIACV